MLLASEERSCIVCILHQNKSAEDRNLRGWIGTELRNKAVEYYQDDLRTKLRMESNIMTDHVLDEQIEKAVTDGIIHRSVSPLNGKKIYMLRNGIQESQTPACHQTELNFDETAES